jgi:DNA polymerase III subunit epsilon
MAWLTLAAIVLFIVFLLRELSLPSKFSSIEAKPVQPPRESVNVELLPPRFIVLDLETTGLDPVRNEIIEIGAIRVNRDSDVHDTFRTLVKPTRRIPKHITQINGISQEMVDREGMALAQALREFVDFIQDLPLVTFNAEFDMAFLQNAAKRDNTIIQNPTSCALKMARLAWPGRASYRLADLAMDGGLSDEGMHHALDDCRRTLIVYSAAVLLLGGTSAPQQWTSAGDSGRKLSPRMRAYRRLSCIPNDPVERNLLGMELEAEGLIGDAISCYQANVRDGFEGNHPYDRLAVIFRKRKDPTNEIAVLTRAVEVFSQLQSYSRSDVAPKLEKFKRRLRRASDLSQKQQQHMSCPSN